MKRGLALMLLTLMFFLILVSLTSLISSQEECDEDCKVDKAYSCLDEKVGDCSTLTSEEKVFSLMALGKCKDNVLSDSNYKSNIKFTSQAILGLKGIKASTDEAKNWLSSENTTSTDIIWYLQIESNEATSCTIKYDTSSYTINIGEDKKLSANAGTCLTRANENYWLKVSQTEACYDKEFSISCDKSFSTNWLYQKKNSDTIYVSGTTNTASKDGIITEKINSLCFGKGTSCDYEGSLWAALALDPLDYDVSPFLPYLIIMADETGNKKYIPEAFLYILIGEFSSDLLAKQKTVNEQYYWDESGDKYYDTALALYPFQYETPEQKTLSKNWLLEVQTEEGCWDNTRNTAFILHSLWPDKSPIAPGIGEEIDCEDAGYFCLSSINCEEAGGNILDYSCAGVYICCSKNLEKPTCAGQEGEICTKDETCDGTTIDASDLGYKEVCCIGSCEEKEKISDCELAGGTCRMSCYSNEKEIFKSCEISSDVCCVVKEKEKKGYAWIIIFSVLIFLVVLGIIFRKKLRMFWFKFKSRFKGGKPSAPPPRGFPLPPGAVFPRAPIGRPLPPRRFIPRPKPREEVSEVLKKLKEMGK